MAKESNNTGILKLSETHTFLQLLSKKIEETNENIHSLQKAIAGLRGQVEDLRTEYEEDTAELKRRLWEFRWIVKEGI